MFPSTEANGICIQQSLNTWVLTHEPTQSTSDREGCFEACLCRWLKHMWLKASGSGLLPSGNTCWKWWVYSDKKAVFGWTKRGSGDPRAWSWVATDLTSRYPPYSSNSWLLSCPVTVVGDNIPSTRRWGRLREIIEVVICRHKMLCKYLLAKRAGVQPEMDCGRGGRWNIHMQATKFLWVLSLCQCPCAPSPESCTYVHDPPLTIWSLVSVSLKELLH